VTRTDSYTDVVRFHGHECPGAGLGLRIAELAVERLGRHEPGNEIIAVSETDSCALDAVQVLTGCTFGKRNLVHQDNGKNTFTFWRRTDGVGMRVKARPGSDAFRDDQIWALAEKIEADMATEEEAKLFAELQQARIERILAAPAEDLLIVEDVTDHVPAIKALRPSEPCEDCGDLTSVAILHNHRGRMLCPPCHQLAHGGALPADHGHGHGHGHDHPRAHPHQH
jgi:formylmethanofuran dehydrogenase subunit E